jgi:hypothetical protein
MAVRISPMVNVAVAKVRQLRREGLLIAIPNAHGAYLLVECGNVGKRRPEMRYGRGRTDRKKTTL